MSGTKIYVLHVVTSLFTSLLNDWASVMWFVQTSQGLFHLLNLLPNESGWWL